MTVDQSQPSFALFGFLPAELRLEIWRQSCRSRVVEVRYSAEQDRCLTTTKPPVLLQVCRESRYEALSRLYTKAFGTKTHPNGTIYFSPTLDILYIPRSGDMGYGDTARDFGQYVLDTAEHVRALAIDHVKPEVRRPWETYNKFCLMRNFPLLRETFLIISLPPSRPPSSYSDRSAESEESYAAGGQIEFVDPRGDQEVIMRLMENVKESFCYEVGHQSQVPSPLDKDEQPEDDGLADGHPEPYLSLVPKTKARVTTHNTHHSWSSQPAFVACA
ncbi:hypothetical protein B0H66DRAFT_398619 [Apodospora peruviana]|uniref:2EXR domain-containing protein n=1 Tax=Apodospora peruviana TaxID=516989 RepID=A0AAE0HTQ6_9PEZI|nr:hypothetical protein B0H66DRAFT_398619 [Apodospora peruviana]